MLADTTRCYTVRELAARWRCRPATVARLIRMGALPAIALPGSRGPRITPEAVQQYEAGHPATPARPAKRQRRRADYVEYIQ